MSTLQPRRVTNSTDCTCRWDVRCCEDEDWQSDNSVDSLAAGSAQPFYHILVDLRDWEDGNPQTAITYVPEELLTPPEVSVLIRMVAHAFPRLLRWSLHPSVHTVLVTCRCKAAAWRVWHFGGCALIVAYTHVQSPETWSEQHGDGSSFMHPFAGMLFLGNDHEGDFLPSKPLREKYSAQRRDVGPSDEDDDVQDDDADGSPDDGSGSGGSPFFGGPSSSGDSGPSGLDVGGPGGFTIM